MRPKQAGYSVVAWDAQNLPVAEFVRAVVPG